MRLFMMNNSRVINMSGACRLPGTPGACRLPGTPEQKEFDKKEYLMWPFYPELPILPKDIENIIIDYLYQLSHSELFVKCERKIHNMFYEHIMGSSISWRFQPETMSLPTCNTQELIQYDSFPEINGLEINHQYCLQLTDGNFVPCSIKHTYIDHVAEYFLEEDVEEVDNF